MVNVLIGNRNIQESNILCQKLANDKIYRVDNVTTGHDVINTYWKINPDILVLDNSLSDLSIEDIVNRLSINPLEQKRCNMILTLTPHYRIELNNVAKINRIIYKSIFDDTLVDVIHIMSTYFYTPDLEVGEVDCILQSLNLNCMSPGYRFMKDAITYCYYKPNELEFLNTILRYLAYKYNVPESRVRDSLTSCIRPFNNTNTYGCSDELYNIMYNNGKDLSLKNFLERIVLYLIKVKKKGKLF